VYVCQCDPSKDDALEAVGSFRQVEVDGEGICNECGYYALFTTTFQGSAMRGMFDSQGCTIFTSNKLFTYFENIRHIESKYQLYKIRKGLSENGYYNGKNYTVILGHKNELPEELKFSEPKPIYVFKTTGSFEGVYDTQKAVTDGTGVSKEIVRKCLKDGQWKTKKGFIITYNKNLNVQEHLKNIKKLRDQEEIDY